MILKYRLEIENQSHKVELENDELGKLRAIYVDDQKFLPSELSSLNDFKITNEHDLFTVEKNGESFNLILKEILDDQQDDSSNSNSLSQMKHFFVNGKLLSPMPGKIVDIRCKEGDIINKGKIVLSLEAMKMENEIHTPFSIKVTKILVNAADSVTEKQLLIEFEIEEE